MADFGRDWSCATDLDGTGRMVQGFDLLAQALVRRLITPRGALLRHPTYGAGILGMIDDVMDARGASRIAALIDAQFRQDQRVQRSTTQATYAGGKVTTTTIVTTAAGPFSLVLSISNVTIDILRASA